MIFSETPRRQLVSQLVTWGHWFALCNIIVAICIAGIYLFSSSPPDSILGLVYLITNWFSHIGFLTFFGFVILILPLCYLFPNSTFLRVWSSAIAAVGLAFLAFDALLYTRHGLHFSFNSADFIKQQTNTALTGFELHHLAFLLISFFIWMLFQLLVANSLWHRIDRLQRLKIGQPISITFVLMFMFSHLTHVWADAKLYQPIVKQDDMFPLSYPATAKTLLSKYELMDLDEYRTKKELQFDNRFDTVTYPKSSLFCSITKQKTTLLVFLDEQIGTSDINDYIQLLALQSIPMHFDLSSSRETGFKTALYGLPELFHDELTFQTPLLIKLMSTGKNQLYSYSADASSSAFLAKYPGKLAKDLNSFNSHLKDEKSGLFLAHVNPNDLSDILGSASKDTNIFVTTLTPESQATTFSNLNVHSNRKISSHQDIAPTLINLLGCDVPDNQHSTGQNLLNNHRNWLVSYHENKIVMLHEGLRTEINPSGNYQLFDYEGAPQSNKELNIPLLGQAVKLLSSFSE